MSAERVNGPPRRPRTRRRVGEPSTAVARIRARAAAAAGELELTPEELRALADEGIDPEEVLALARAPRDDGEVSEFDRDSAHDEIEGLRTDEGY
jgi:hypothetical protein